MGKFFKYENSNWRTFVIDTTAETIKRPKRKVTLADMIGCIIELDGAIVTPVSVKESDGDITVVLVGDVTVESTTSAGFVTLTYDVSDDEFTYGETELDNIMIDEYGREEMFI